MGKNEYDKVWQKERRRKLKEQGLCTCCGKNTPLAGYKRCECCSKKANQAVTRCARKRKHKLKSAGLCCCGREPIKGKKTCENCNDRGKKKYLQRKIAGLCSYCNNAVVSGKTRCLACSEKHKEARRILRIEVFEAYGGFICKCCGEVTNRFLTLDHINNDGKEHRKKVNTTCVFRWLKENNYPPGFQILCFNCNLGRQLNGGICPHKGMK